MWQCAWCWIRRCCRSCRATSAAPFTANLQRLELAPGPAPRSLAGIVELRDLRQVGAQPMDLGSYRVTFDGSPAQDGALTGKLHDLGGPFIVDGTLQLSGRRTATWCRVTSRAARPRPSAWCARSRWARRPTPPGRSTFSFEGFLI